ncbi:MAG: fumarylacetoacetate hydrolase family protein [Deltaproteobacteria bacterium]|nr:fumarylacetoacetate hydrolase family protein [Deltaproteobacteria bacterium]MCB9785087.1 fumarylacetoacetate hydrolase family protein [Deltaproteobacteria bacterium]
MSDARAEAYGDELYAALRARAVVEPLTAREPEITIDDAYAISKRLVARRVADGERIIGKKIGVSSLAVQRMLDVHQPDFGFLTDRMVFDDGAAMPISTTLIQPRAEGEIAFVLGRPLRGTGLTHQDVLDATDAIVPCFEVVDSRIRDWKIRIQDTVADNASCGLFVLGSERVDPRGLDLAALKMTVWKNDVELSVGYGSAALGTPLECVRWLAETLGAYGITLDAGDIILSGSLVPLEPVVAGDTMRLELEQVGSASVRFT